MSNKLIGNCPSCGKVIEIPEELTEFSCLYCGVRSHTELLREQKDFSQEELLELSSQLPQTLRDHGELYKHINKKDYVPTFQGYEAEFSVLLKRLDRVVHSAPMGIETTVETVSKVFLDTMEKDLQEVKGYDNRVGKSRILFEIKVVLAFFLTPLCRKLNLRMAEPFRKALHSQWMERFPKEEWIPGDYDEIAGGFRKKKLCYITTATCSHEGKPDDCMELTTFRSFRDGWLTEHGGEALIENYYALAPTLVTLMNHCDSPEKCYAEIRTRWLEPCLRALESQNPEACRDTYVEMVTTLQERYCPM
jgi:predicted RNA-binding Zn-ribbon protein involved in translation (DUF1610 family)